MATTAMTDEHKTALAEGRNQGRAVRAYLEALETSRPKRGRRRTEASITTRLAAIEEAYDDADVLTRLHLAQERLDLTDELATMGDTVDITALEAGFVEVAAAYAQRKNISYAALRSVGVPAAVLKRAGIPRSN